ncbi:MAG TPA: hypothetical protein VFQ91_13375 [Bryobacteraceae bacterium]|nr:hypothetical protein [Bryobacteraceae bacterium]
MAQIREDLSKRIRSLEKEVQDALEDKERAFRYRWEQGKAKFEEEVLSEHRKLKLGLPSYIRQSRFLAAVTAPAIYLGIVPFGLLDLFLGLFQGICFPVYGIPKVRRADYLIFDRGQLKYVNLLERLNCMYCSYANGLLAYATEIAARTEQHWCPIKHAHRLRSPHSRYPHFLDYGDARRYREQIETVRNDFVDLRSVQPAPPNSNADSGGK